MVEDETKKDIKRTATEEAIQAATELRAANAERKELLDREERMRAEDIVSGRAEAGRTAPVAKSPEEIKKEGALEFFKGSEIEKALKKHG